MYNGINGDEVNKREEETVSATHASNAPSSPLPCSNSITCISYNIPYTTTNS